MVSKAQTLSEYSLFLVIALMAIIGMNFYVKRGLQGRYKDMAESAREALQARTAQNVLRQYEPYYLDSDYETSANKDIKEIISDGNIRNEFLATDEPMVVEGSTTENANIEGAILWE